MKFNRHSLIYGLYLLVLIAIAQYAGDSFQLPIWPAYMCLILFFVEQSDLKKVSHILVGGIAGIAGILLFPPVIALLAPFVGVEGSKVGLILVLVYAIVAFNASLPIVFNNYTFLFLTASGLAPRAPRSSPFVWMAVAAFGGALLIAGAMGIGRIVGPPTTPAVAD